MAGNDVLSLWHLLTAASPDKAACQNLLLAIPEASSFSFEADPSATSADLEAYKEGSSMLLAASSPAAKALAKNIHVGLVVVSKDSFCCGVFNGKEVSMRVDPVVRMCGLPPSGQKGGCTNTSHIGCKLSFEGERLLIQTPAVSKATTRALFSQPYLVVDSLPKGFNLPMLLELKAPPNVWRLFIAETQVIYTSKPAAKPDLMVSTAAAEGEFEATKEESPMSYEVIGRGSKVESSSLGGPEKPDPRASLRSLADDTLLKNVDADLLGFSVTSAFANLGLKMSERADDASASSLAREQDVFDDLLDDEEEDVASEASRLSGTSSYPSVSLPRGPPAGSESSQAALPSSKYPKGSDPMILFQNLVTLQNNIESRVRTLELENKELRRRATKSKELAVQAVRTAVSTQTDLKAAKTALRKQIALTNEQTLESVKDRGFSQGPKLLSDFEAITRWKGNMDERIGSLELDMRNEDGLVLSLNRDRPKVKLRRGMPRLLRHQGTLFRMRREYSQ